MSKSVLEKPWTYQAPPDLLAKRTILVTGASDGIGRAAAECFARHGATVVLSARTVEKLEAVYDAIEAAGGPQPAIYPVDFQGAGGDDYAQLAATLERELGGLDGLLHNAGILGPRTSIERLRPEQWDEVLRVNLTAPFLLTQAMLPLLRAAPDPAVVFTSSGVGRRGRAYWGAYAVSKFGIEGLSQVLAQEVENTDGIRVNSLNPGATRTAMRRRAYPGEDPERNPAPEDIMPAYLYLIGPDSRGVTGGQFDAQPPR